MLVLVERDKSSLAQRVFSKVSERTFTSSLAKEASEHAAAQALIDAGKEFEAAILLEKLLRDDEDSAGNARDLLKKSRKQALRHLPGDLNRRGKSSAR